MNILTLTDQNDTGTGKSVSYTYDILGNITTGDSGTYTYNQAGWANPHAATSIGGITQSYDLNGNLASALI